MQPSSEKVRSVLSSVVGGVLALCSVNGTLPLAAAHAAGPATTPSLVISEVNWSGSAGMPADQWVELSNPTAMPVSLSGLSLRAGTAQPVSLAACGSTSVLPGMTYLVSRMDPSHSTLSSSNCVLPTLTLSPAALSLSLLDSAGTVLDTAGNGGMPLAGSATASMSRYAGAADGSKAASWYTPHTIGSKIKAGVTQYGTPGEANQELDSLSGLSLVPASPATAPAVVQVSGQNAPALSGVGRIFPQLVSVTAEEVKTGVMTTGPVQVISTSLSQPTSFTVSSPVLMPGAYRLWLNLKGGAAATDRSLALPVPTGSAQNVYVVNAPAAQVPAAPVLTPGPGCDYRTSGGCTVNTASVLLKGTVSQPGTELVLAVNGATTTVSVPPTATTFSLPVALLADQLNTIELRAQNSAGTSQPTVAYVTQQNAAVVPGKVLVHANPPGTADTVEGQAGAVTGIYPAATVELFADSSLSQASLVGSSPVAADGSFAPISIGDNKYGQVYLGVVNGDGQVSPATRLVVPNPIAFAGQPVSVSFTVVPTANGATISWQPVPGAVAYRLQISGPGGQGGATLALCQGTAPCSYQTTVSGAPGTAYTVGLAAVDQYGNVSNFTSKGFSTLPAPVVATTAVQSTPAASTPAPAATPAPSAPASKPTVRRAAPTAAIQPAPATATPTPSATASPSPTPTASASPEAGQVKSAEDTGTTSRNLVPWIILAVLVALAILATAGYFYWFGGEAGDEAAAAALAARNERERQAAASKKKEEPVTPERTTPPKDKEAEAPPKEKKPGDREKRW